MARKRMAAVPGASARVPQAGLVAATRRSPHSKGLTLIELLVVMVILSLLVGAAIPVLSPASDARRVREAARNISTYLTGAQTRAIETGRPFGVRLRKLSRDTVRDADNGVCVEMSYIEVPPPFAGFDENSRVRIATARQASNPIPERGLVFLQFVTSGQTAENPSLPPGIDHDVLPPGFVRPGDIVIIDGERYELTELGNLDEFGFYTENSGDGPLGENILQARPVDGNENPLTGADVAISVKWDNAGANLVAEEVAFALSAGTPPPPSPYWSDPLPYQIFRQPTLTSNEPYQLPEGSAIDLRASGIGGVAFFEDDQSSGSGVTPPTATNPTTSNRDPIDILFSPEGTIERLQFNLGIDGAAQTSEATTDTLFLLVGSSLTLSNSAAEADFGGSAGQGTEAEIADRAANINWLNTESRWVTVGARTGTVRTSENAFVNPVTSGSFPGDLTNRRNAEIQAARALAIEGAQIGGR